MVVATAIKQDSKHKGSDCIGVTFVVADTGLENTNKQPRKVLLVDKVDSNGPFSKTAILEGERVISINDIPVVVQQMVDNSMAPVDEDGQQPTSAPESDNAAVDRIAKKFVTTIINNTPVGKPISIVTVPAQAKVGMVTKESISTVTGINVAESSVDGTIYISQIAPGGLFDTSCRFGGSELQPGQHVVSINGIHTNGLTAVEAADLIRDTEGGQLVTVVAIESNNTPPAAEVTTPEPAVLIAAVGETTTKKASPTSSATSHSSNDSVESSPSSSSSAPVIIPILKTQGGKYYVKKNIPTKLAPYYTKHHDLEWALFCIQIDTVLSETINKITASGGNGYLLLRYMMLMNVLIGILLALFLNLLSGLLVLGVVVLQVLYYELVYKPSLYVECRNRLIESCNEHDDHYYTQKKGLHFHIEINRMSQTLQIEVNLPKSNSQHHQYRNNKNNKKTNNNKEEPIDSSFGSDEYV